MDVQICSGAGKQFMIIETEEEVNGYEREMLEKNKIESLLPFYMVCKNGQNELWYDVTSMKSLDTVFRERGIDFKVLLEIFSYANEAMIEISKYLINESNILFQPNTMFLSDNKMKLCYLPSANDGKTPFIQLGEYLISNVDPGREFINRFCYELYNMMASPGFDCSEACKRIREKVYREEEIRRDRENDIRERNARNEEEGVELGLQVASLYDDCEENEDDKQRVGESRIRKHFEELLKRIKEAIELLISDFIPEKELDLEGEKDIGRLIYDGEMTEDDYCVDKEIFKVGSVSGNDAVLHSTLLSRHHSKIKRKNGKFYLSDWNSRKGTYLNGRRLRRGEVVELQPMDKIVFADVPYRWA